MDDASPDPLRIDSVAHLDSQRWERAITRTNEIVIARLKQPVRTARRESDYPPILVGVVIVLLVLVALAAFLISAGKQIVAFDIVNRFLWQRYNTQISPFYGQVIVVAALLLSEAGVILFGLAANTLTDESTLRRVFRAFQFGCVLIALSANVSVTAVNVAAEMPVFDWLVTLLAPVMVIGIGVVVEALVHRWIVDRRAQLAEYRRSVAAYELAASNPQTLPDYNEVWGNQILDQLIKVSAKNKTLIEQLIEQDPTVRSQLAEREWSRRQWSFNPGPKVSEISEKVSEKAEMTLERALKILESDPKNAEKKGVDLVNEFGGSPSTWSRALNRYKEEAA